MGAANVETTLIGKTLTEAYRQAVRQAEYEDGHDPYNGTISTANGVVEVKIDFGRIPVRRVIRAIWDLGTAVSVDNQAEIKKCLNVHRIPDRMRRDVIRAARIVDESKWGTWVAIPLPYARQKEIKARAGLARTHNNVWVALGWAAE